MNELKRKSIVSLLIMILLLFMPIASMRAMAKPSQNEVSIDDPPHLDPEKLKGTGTSAWGFRPSNAVVKAGGDVTFVNHGSLPHTVNSYTEMVQLPFLPFPTPVPDGIIDSTGGNWENPAFYIFPGSSWTLDTSVLDVGTYTYFCFPHPWMMGTLEVRESGPSEVTVNIRDGLTPGGGTGEASWGFRPTNVVVRQGESIVFTNNGLMIHTVTSGLEGEPGHGDQFDSGVILPLWLATAIGLPFLATYTLDTSTLEPGTYDYHCDPHPWMTGKVKVLPS